MIGNYFYMEGMGKLTLIDNMADGVTFMLILQLQEDSNISIPDISNDKQE